MSRPQICVYRGKFMNEMSFSEVIDAIFAKLAVRYVREWAGGWITGTSAM